MKHENINLLFFLNGLMESVLDSISGSFEKSAKYKFGNISKSIRNLEKDVLSNCNEAARETYGNSLIAISEVLNKTIQEYNDGNINEFLKYIEAYESTNIT